MRRKIPESEYRASRICRVLGNPTAYKIIKLLLEEETTPTQLARELNVTVATVSVVLRNLRNIDLIRYEAKANERVYWIKNPTLAEIVTKLEESVKHVRTQNW